MKSGPENLNVLIIGAGITGERHAKAQHALGSKLAIYDTNPTRLTQIAQKFGAEMAENLPSAIAQSNLVYVCTPIDQHLEPVSLAIGASKPVFCEKPITGSWDEARKIQHLAHQTSIPVAVGNYYVLNGSISEVLKRVKQGQIGSVRSIDAAYLHNMEEYRLKTPWRATDPFLYDGGVHPVHLALLVANEPVNRLMALAGPVRNPDYPFPQDYQLIWESESGLLTNVHVSSEAHVPHGAYLTVYGSKETIRARNLDPYFEICKKGSERFKRVPVGNGSLPIDLAAGIMNDFVLGKRDNFDPLPGIDESVECIKILDAAEISIEYHTSVKP